MSPRAPAAPTPGVDAELKALLRKVKLGRCLDTLPEGLALALARTESMPHADFLSLLLADEVERRDRSSAQLRARAAKLDPATRSTRSAANPARRSTGNSGTSCARCGSSTTPAALSSWDP